MSNKSIGTRFERELAETLAKNWFWVHLFQDNKNGQPCDVIAARGGRAYLFDCKSCESRFFVLSRIEENQYNAMKLFELTGNEKGLFALRYPNGGIYLMTCEKLKELEQAGFKRISEAVCQTQGMRLEQWLESLKNVGEWGNGHAGGDWK